MVLVSLGWTAREGNVLSSLSGCGRIELVEVCVIADSSGSPWKNTHFTGPRHLGNDIAFAAGTSDAYESPLGGKSPVFLDSMRIILRSRTRVKIELWDKFVIAGRTKGVPDWAFVLSKQGRVVGKLRISMPNSS
ncbi:hypothetical protein PM082_024611 [Marasmius tenuissimus]|nr:hypothetical protein PM082_024611 [Marasmius tenuissimus]